MSSDSFKKSYQQTIRLQIIYDMNKEDSALNKQQVLVCHKTQRNP